MKTDSKPITGIILETRKPHKSGKYPVKLRVNYRTERKYYVLWDENNKNLSLSKDEFSKVMRKNPREPYKFLRLHLNELERIAVEDVINKIPVFTFEEFEARFFTKVDKQADLFIALENRAKELKKEVS
jgi:hypothetical protein